MLAAVFPPRLPARSALPAFWQISLTIDVIFPLRSRSMVKMCTVSVATRCASMRLCQILSDCHNFYLVRFVYLFLSGSVVLTVQQLLCCG